MNNTKDMASSIVALRHAAVALNNIADFLEDLNAKDSAPATENQSQETKSAASTDATVPVPVPVAEPETPKLSFEDVRGILADIARAGNREGVKALLEKYGASKLSALDPKCYADVLKDAEVLKNA